jgi:hypothetical protein
MSRIEISGSAAFILTFLVSMPLAYLIGPFVVLIWLVWPFIRLWFWGIQIRERTDIKNGQLITSSLLRLTC